MRAAYHPQWQPDASPSQSFWSAPIHIRNSDHYVRPGGRDDYLQAISAWAAAARAAGADRIAVMEGLIDPGWIARIEAWPDQRACARFEAGAGAKFADRFTRLVVPERSRVSQATNVEPTETEWAFRDVRVQPSWMPYGPVYIHNTWIYLKPGTVEVALEKINHEVRFAKKRELGMLHFDVYQSVEDENLIHTYEVYVEQGAHLFHYEQAYLKTSMTR